MEPQHTWGRELPADAPSRRHVGNASGDRTDLPKNEDLWACIAQAQHIDQTQLIQACSHFVGLGLCFASHPTTYSK